MPRNRHHLTLWIDGPKPDNFFEAFEQRDHALALARKVLDDWALGGNSEVKPDRYFIDALRHRIYRLLHPLGIHEWVKVMVYNPELDRIIDPGRGRVTCRNCRV